MAKIYIDQVEWKNRHQQQAPSGMGFWVFQYAVRTSHDISRGQWLFVGDYKDCEKQAIASCRSQFGSAACSLSVVDNIQKAEA